MYTGRRAGSNKSFFFIISKELGNDPVLIAELDEKCANSKNPENLEIAM